MGHGRIVDQRKTVVEEDKTAVSNLNTKLHSEGECMPFASDVVQVTSGQEDTNTMKEVLNLIQGLYVRIDESARGLRNEFYDHAEEQSVKFESRMKLLLGGSDQRVEERLTEERNRNEMMMRKVSERFFKEEDCKLAVEVLNGKVLELGNVGIGESGVISTSITTLNPPMLTNTLERLVLSSNEEVVGEGGKCSNIVGQQIKTQAVKMGNGGIVSQVSVVNQKVAAAPVLLSAVPGTGARNGEKGGEPLEDSGTFSSALGRQFRAQEAEVGDESVAVCSEVSELKGHTNLVSSTSSNKVMNHIDFIRSSGETTGKRRCFLCGQSGHQVSECPEGVGRVGASSRTCWACGEAGHTVAECSSEVVEQRKCGHCGRWGHTADTCSRRGGIADEGVVGNGGAGEWGGPALRAWREAGIGMSRRSSGGGRAEDWRWRRGKQARRRFSNRSSRGGSSGGDVDSSGSSSGSSREVSDERSNRRGGYIKNSNSSYRGSSNSNYSGRSNSSYRGSSSSGSDSSRCTGRRHRGGGGGCGRRRVTWGPVRAAEMGRKLPRRKQGARVSVLKKEGGCSYGGGIAKCSIATAVTDASQRAAARAHAAAVAFASEVMKAETAAATKTVSVSYQQESGILMRRWTGARQW